MRKLVFAALCLLLVIPCRAGTITVKLQTNVGDISVALFPDKAPVTVENFLNYVESGFYSGLIFHRVISGFVIQGGGFDPNYNMRDPCAPIINESYNGLSNLRGTIAMARTDAPDSATSQFFINHADNLFLDWQSPANVGYCVFGQVVDGMNVVDAIANEPTGEVNFPVFGMMQDVPTGPNSPIIIYAANIVDSNYCTGAIAGDLDGNCRVNFIDFALMAANWLDRESSPEFHMGQTTKIATHHDLSGDVFVWEQDINNIYGYNLSDGNVFAVCTEGHNQREPAISGNIVVWRDYRNYGTGGTDIYGRDISSPNEPNGFAICTAVGGQQTPAIDGNIVVWDDYRSSKHDIYGYSLLTESEFPICTVGFAQQPAVSGNIVVWRDGRGGGDYDIYGADITNPAEPNEFVICNANGDQVRPVISGNIVVWEDHRDANLAIYGYDLSTHTEFFIVSIASGDVTNYDVSDNTVVWQDNRSGRWDIYGYNVLTADEFVISTADGNQIEPVISDGTVAWRDYRGFANDLYWVRLCSGYLAGDLNGDCVVDINDFSTFASQWLNCNIDPPEFCWQ